MTFPDLTAYPFATQVAKDWRNLLEVYLDAVFAPRLDPLDFAQEGHRLSPVSPDKRSVDKESPDKKSEEKKEWEVVVSYLMDNKNKGISPVFNFLPFERVYKRLKINDKKEVVGIYMFSEVK